MWRLRAPALLDAPEAPDGQRPRPRHDEQPDHEVAREVEVDAGDRLPHGAVQVEPRAEDAQQLHRPDDERDHHRQCGDREVVEDLAHGPRERPAVGEVHERAVDRVQQRHPRGEQHGQAEDRVERQPGAGRARRQEQQGDLGRRVEAEPEQDAERVHLPRPRDGPGEAAVDAAHDAPGLELRLELGLVEGAGPHAAEDPGDAHEHTGVQRRDHVEEGARDRGPDEARDVVQRRRVVRHLPAQRAEPERAQQGQGEHDARVPEREEEADAQRPPALGHELARGVVDRRDVVGVEGVTHAQRVRGHAEPEAEHALRAEAEVLRDDREQQQPEAEHVQPADRRGERARAAPLRAAHRPPPAAAVATCP